MKTIESEFKKKKNGMKHHMKQDMTQDMEKDMRTGMTICRHRIHSLLADKRSLKTLAETQGDTINWGQRILRVPELWLHSRGQGVNVAVLDTGIDLHHRDLVGAVIDYKDFTGEGIRDFHGHGTHVAGIVAARGNDIGFIGVAPLCNLLIGKVMDKDGYGPYERVAEGIYWAVKKGAHIITLSIRGTESSHVLYQAVQYALYKGVIVVSAAGNDGELLSLGPPSCYGGCIAVGGHDKYGHPCDFSSQGQPLDFLAPADRILSTFKDGGYAVLSGTSMASPIVAGLAALILAKHLTHTDNKTPVNNTEDMKNHLKKGARYKEHSPQRGYGHLTALADIYDDLRAA